MALRALTIVEEEIAHSRKHAGGCAGSNQMSIWSVGSLLDSLEARIRDRITKECIEIPTCQRCHENPADDRLLVFEDPGELPCETDICSECVRALREDGVCLERLREEPDFDIQKDDADEECHHHSYGPHRDDIPF